MSGDQEATYHRLMRYLWDEGPQPVTILRGRSFGNWDAIQHCFSGSDDATSLSWLEDYRKRAEATSVRQRNNRGTTVVQPSSNNGTSTDAPSREEEDKESKSKKENTPPVSSRRGPRKKNPAEPEVYFDDAAITPTEAAAELSALVEKRVDFDHYTEAISVYSATKDVRRTRRGWIATYRQFVRQDEEKGALRRQKPKEPKYDIPPGLKAPPVFP
jgi:hypothetical protein